MKKCRDLGRRGSKREGGGARGRAEKSKVEVSLFIIKNLVLQKPGIRNVYTKPQEKFVAAWP